MIAPARFGKDKVIEVAIATGTDMSSADAEPMMKAGIQVSYVPMPNSVRGALFATLTNFQLGAEEPDSLFVNGESLGWLSKLIGRPIFAVLGANYFKGRIVRFDFGKKTISILEKFPFDPAAVGANASAKAPLIAEMRLDRSIPTDKTVTLPVVEFVVYNGKTIRTLLETGQTAAFSLSPTAAKEIGLTTAVDKGKITVANLDQIKFNDLEFKDVSIILHGKESGFDIDLKDYGAVAGLGILQNFVVTFEFAQKRVALERIPPR